LEPPERGVDLGELRGPEGSELAVDALLDGIARGGAVGEKSEEHVRQRHRAKLYNSIYSGGSWRPEKRTKKAGPEGPVRIRNNWVNYFFLLDFLAVAFFLGAAFFFVAISSPPSR
jgi:hypothetical protein